MRDRPDQGHPVLQRPGVAGQRCAACPERRMQPFDVCGVEHAVALRAASERLHACGGAIHHAALRIAAAPPLVACDDVGDQDGAPGMPPPPALPCAPRIAQGRAHRPDVRAPPIGAPQQRTARGTAAAALKQPSDQRQGARRAALAAQPHARRDHHGQRHPHEAAWCLAAQRIGVPLPQGAWSLDHLRVPGVARSVRADPPIRDRACVEAPCRHHRWHGTPRGELRHDEAPHRSRGAQAVTHRPCGSATRLRARVAAEPLCLL